jgi:hypothetical protein
MSSRFGRAEFLGEAIIERVGYGGQVFHRLFDFPRI